MSARIEEVSRPSQGSEWPSPSPTSVFSFFAIKDFLPNLVFVFFQIALAVGWGWGGSVKESSLLGFETEVSDKQRSWRDEKHHSHRELPGFTAAETVVI